MFDIRSLREQSGITQAALAQRLGITQVQVSRYEANPGTVPVGLLQDYLSALGVDLVTALTRTESVRPSPMPALGDGYRGLRDRLAGARTYLAGIRTAIAVDEELLQLTERVQAQLSRPNPKPRVLLAGNFDAAKSHLANTLLGDRYLPSRYQPETRIPIYVRHLQDRPDFIREDVWIMDLGFDPARWQEAGHAQAHRRLGGNFLTLDAWASHTGTQCRESAGAALAFVDAPLLRACELLDTPGSVHNPHDDRISDDMTAGAELVIYCSPAKGFLSGSDVLRIRCLAQQWTGEKADQELPFIERFFVVATHADPSLPDVVLGDILERGAARLAEELSTVGSDAAALPNETLRQRLFSFWSESGERSRPLMEALHETLSERYPKYVALQFDRYVDEFKRAAGALCTARVDLYRRVREQLRGGLTPEMPWPSMVVDQGAGELRERIHALRDASKEKIIALYRRHASAETVEALIRREFSDRRSASQYAAARVVADLQHAVVSELENGTQTLLPYVMDRLGLGDVVTPDWPTEGVADPISVPPNARGLVLGSLAGLAWLGPIAASASNLGPWGGYLVVAQGITTLGVSTAGTAAALSAVSAIGGPGVLAAGLMVVTTVLGGSFIGRKWQNRLAQTIARHVDKLGLLDQILAATDRYWSNLVRMLEQDLSRAERSRDRLSRNLAATLSSDHPEEGLDRLIGRLGDARALLTHIPWETCVDRVAPGSWSE